MKICMDCRRDCKRLTRRLCNTCYSRRSGRGVMLPAKVRPAKSREVKPANNLTDAERAELVESMRGYIFQCAIRRSRHLDLPLREQRKHELVAAGYEGAAIAAVRFDGSRGFQFSTFAVYWIHQTINRDCAMNDFPKGYRDKKKAGDSVSADTIPSVVQLSIFDSAGQSGTKSEFGMHSDHNKLDVIEGDVMGRLAFQARQGRTESWDNAEWDALLEPLPVRWRVVVEDQFRYGRKKSQIAKSLGISKERVGQITESALGILRVRLEMRGLLAA